MLDLASWWATREQHRGNARQCAVTEWWRRAVEQWRASPPSRHWQDVVAFGDLSRRDQKRVDDRCKAGLRSVDPAVRELAWLITGDTVVADLDREPASQHLRFEVAAAFERGRPLEPGAKVSGCRCTNCFPLALHRPKPQRARKRAPLDLDAARASSIVGVAARLGLELHGRKREYARCPFHSDEHPSLHLNERKQRAFCNPCGRSWDTIGLVMDYQRITLPEAVRWIAAPDTLTPHRNSEQ